MAAAESWSQGAQLRAYVCGVRHRRFITRSTRFHEEVIQSQVQLLDDRPLHVILDNVVRVLCEGRVRITANQQV
jgi:hypothetical protein